MPADPSTHQHMLLEEPVPVPANLDLDAFIAEIADPEQVAAELRRARTRGMETAANELAVALARIVTADGDRIRRDLLAEARAALDLYRETPSLFDSDGTEVPHVR